MMKKVSKIIILAGYPFPIGLAPTTRIIAYAKGLIANGVDAEVLNYGHVAPDDKLKDADVGYVEGVKYRYSYRRKGHSCSLIRWTWDNVASRINAIRYLFTHRKEISYVFLSFDSILDVSFFVIPLYILGLNTLFIGDEYPIPIREKLKDDIPYLKKLFYKFMSIFIKGRILMTNNLKVFYNKIYYKPTFILPTIVNFERFNINKSANHNQEEVLTYVGNLDLTKDNVDNIIRAYQDIRKDFPHMKFYIYGPLNPKNIHLKDLIKSLGLSDVVILKGHIDSTEVPNVMMNSTVLVSSQPKTKRAEGGFPTKLGEYLSTGVPTVMTDSGEISKYVTSSKHLWLAKPEDPIDFANKVKYVLNNYDLALSVANSGRQYIEEHCTSQSVTLGLIEFLSNL